MLHNSHQQMKFTLYVQARGHYMRVKQFSIHTYI